MYANHVLTTFAAEHKTLWLGPCFVWWPEGRVSVVVTPRIEAHVLSLDIIRTEDLAENGSIVQSWRDDFSEDRWIWTYGLLGTVDVFLYDRLFLSVGAGHSWMLSGDERVRLGPDTLTLGIDGYYLEGVVGWEF